MIYSPEKPSSLPTQTFLPTAPGPAFSQEHWGKQDEVEEGWEQQAVCVLSPLLHKACWTSFWQVSDFFGEPDFWPVSDNVNPESVSPGNSELQKLKKQIYTKKEQQSTQKHSQKHLPIS